MNSVYLQKADDMVSHYSEEVARGNSGYSWSLDTAREWRALLTERDLNIERVASFITQVDEQVLEKGVGYCLYLGWIKKWARECGVDI